MKELLYIPGGSYVIFSANGNFINNFEQQINHLKSDYPDMNEEELLRRLLCKGRYCFDEKFVRINNLMPIQLLTESMFEIVEVGDK